MSIQQIICYKISSTLNYIGTCENAISILWVRRFYQGDDFKIRIPATKDNIKLFAKGNAIELISDKPTEKSYFCGIITSISMAHTVSGEQITISGTSPDGFLEKRILQKYTEGQRFMDVIFANAGDDADPARKFPATQIITYPNFAGVFADTMIYKKVSDFVQKAGQELKVGLQSYINHNTKKFEIVARQAVDRSVNQSAVKPVVFSNEYENVSEFAYDYNSLGTINSVFVYSDAQKSNVTLHDVDAYEKWIDGKNSSGFDRCEKVVKISPSLTTEKRIIDPVAGIFEMWTILDYDKTNIFATDKAKSQYAYPTEFFDCKLLLFDNYDDVFKNGDIITLQNTVWNVTVDTNVTEITHLYDKNGTKITATFGETYKSMFEIFTNRQEG